MKKTPEKSGREIVANQLGSEILHKLESLGLIVLTEGLYRHYLDTLALHTRYLDIISTLQAGHESIVISHQERARINSLYPNPPLPTCGGKATKQAPQPKNIGGQPSCRKP